MIESSKRGALIRGVETVASGQTVTRHTKVGQLDLPKEFSACLASSF